MVRCWAVTLALALAGCATEPMTDQERASSDRTIRALEVLNAGVNGGRASPMLAPNPVAYLKSQYVSGQNRICVYDRLGSQYILTVGAVQLCPISQ